MESNDKLKEINITNQMCYLDDIIKMEDFDFDILIDGKLYKNILADNISYKTLIGAKPLRIRSVKVVVFIKDYNLTRYLVLLGPEKSDVIGKKIRYLVGQKSSIAYVFLS